MSSSLLFTLSMLGTGCRNGAERYVAWQKGVRHRGIEPRPHPWKGRILTIRPMALPDFHLRAPSHNNHLILNANHNMQCHSISHTSPSPTYNTSHCYSPRPTTYINCWTLSPSRFSLFTSHSFSILVPSFSSLYKSSETTVIASSR